MFQRVAVAVLAALFAAGCQRNLDMPAVPNTVPLSVSASIPVLAPRQQATFVAIGGSGTYGYAFLNGNKPSGPDSTIDPLTGAYTAGSAGSAVDVVEVTDGVGATAIASISVGARISIAPLSPSLSPGGRVTFAASGGAGGFTYSLVSAGSGAGAGIDPSTGLYTAGATGRSADVIQVTDLAGATATTTATIGDAVRIYPADLSVAPHESASFIALGGKPPYRFTFQSVGSGSSASVDPDSGAYVAGNRPAPDAGTGTVTDLVLVTDSADVPQTSVATVTVGERLRLLPPGRTPHPGETIALSATGGKPPYVFGFAAWGSSGVGGRDPLRTAGGNGGNRSGGTVEAATGLYRPGASPGAVDFFQVTDSTGAPAAILQGDRIGGRQLSIGGGTKTCTAIDLDGDLANDVAFLGRTDSSNFSVSKIVTGQFLASAEPILRTYFMSGWPKEITAPVVLDSGFSGRDTLLLIGGQTSTSQVDAWALAPDLQGALSARYVSFATASNGGAQYGAGYWDTSGASPTWRLVSDAQEAVGAGYDCPAGGTADVDAVVTRFDWVQGSAGPTNQHCYRVQQFCSFCGPTVHRGFVAMALGDFTGDSSLDLAWITDTGGTSKGASGANAKVSIGAGTTGSQVFGVPTAGWPSGYTFDLPWGEPVAPRFLVARRPTGAAVSKDALVVRLVDPTGRPKLFAFRNGTVLTTATGFDPNPGGAGVDGIVALDGNATVTGSRTSFAAWSGIDGAISAFELDWSTTPLTFISKAPLATFPFAVSGGCFADVNTDGVPDLVAASDWGATAGIELGDGSNSSVTSGATFGARSHQHGMEWPVAVSDFDGDGLLDAAVGVAGQGLSVMWGGGGQLAWGSPLTPASAGFAVAGDFTGDGKKSVLYQEKSGKFGRVTFDGGRSSGFSAVGPFDGVSANGASPAGSYFFGWAADLGTAATPGGDMLSFSGGDGSVVAALLHQRYQATPGSPYSYRVVDVRSSTVTPPATHSQRDLWPAAVGLDRPIVAAISSFKGDSGGPVDSVGLYTATILNPDGAPGSPSTPAFSGWTLQKPAALNVGATPIWSPAGVFDAAIASAGTVKSGVLAGRAVFLLNTDKLYAVEVSVDSGTNFTVTPYPVGPSTQSASAFLAWMGQLAATSDFHVIATGNDGMTVIRRTGGTAAPLYEVVQRLGVPYFPIGVGPVVSGSPGDVVGFLGDFGGSGVAPEIIPLPNDGTGKLH